MPKLTFSVVEQVAAPSAEHTRRLARLFQEVAAAVQAGYGTPHGELGCGPCTADIALLVGSHMPILAFGVVERVTTLSAMRIRRLVRLVQEVAHGRFRQGLGPPTVNWATPRA